MTCCKNGASVPKFGPGSSWGGFQSAFEEIIAQKINALGYCAIPQVICQGYKIDLGIVDCSIPDRYLLAVECNGDGHDCTPEGKARDEKRRKHIEKKGWTVHTICQVNWTISKDEECTKLSEAIEARRQAILNEDNLFSKLPS